jgi:hypothetical protein
VKIVCDGERRRKRKKEKERRKIITKIVTTLFVHLTCATPPSDAQTSL